MPEIAIADVPEQARYVVDVDGRRAGSVTYRLGDGQIALLHAEVEPAMRTRGIASRLIEFTLDDARVRGLSVLPYCPFVRWYIEQHDEYLALVPLDAQARFGL
ncbi:MAG TPA: GNAT family N-acetyltransferase [Solirubrobacteraceae bacterium]|nr:GNAT family N-acetyltransferase [Solirubrobacteraceae bacterium]